MEKRIRSVHELAEYREISVNTLYSWVSQKLIPYIKCGRLTKFDKRVIDRLIEKGEMIRIAKAGKRAIDFKGLKCYILRYEQARLSHIGISKGESRVLSMSAAKIQII